MAELATPQPGIQLRSLALWMISRAEISLAWPRKLLAEVSDLVNDNPKHNNMTVNRALKRSLQAAYQAAVRGAPSPSTEEERLGDFHRVDQGTQVLLRMQYRDLVRQGAPL